MLQYLQLINLFDTLAIIEAQCLYKLSQEEQLFIKSYWKHPQIPLTIMNISEQISMKFGVKESKRDFKWYLKSEIDYSYQNGGSITYRGDSGKFFLYQQSIFSSILLIQIFNNKLIINID